MGILTRFLRQNDHENATNLRQGWENAKTLQEVTYTTIESVIILAALDIALSRQTNWVLWAIYVLAFLALASYLLMFIKFFINAMNEKFALIRNSYLFSWIAGISSLFASLGITFVLPKFISAFVEINFMQ